jgi:predicted protein tyrosine phosphatase
MSSVLTHLGWSKFQMLFACLEWLSKLSCPTATFVPLAAAQMGFILLEVWHQALITSNFTTHLRQKSSLCLNILFEWHLLVLQLVHQLKQPEQTCLESWAEHRCFPICIVTRKCCSRNEVVPSCTTIYRNIKSPGCGCAFLYADNVEYLTLYNFFWAVHQWLALYCGKNSTQINMLQIGKIYFCLIH